MEKNKKQYRKRVDNMPMLLDREKMNHPVKEERKISNSRRKKTVDKDINLSGDIKKQKKYLALLDEIIMLQENNLPLEQRHMDVIDKIKNQTPNESLNIKKRIKNRFGI